MFNILNVCLIAVTGESGWWSVSQEVSPCQQVWTGSGRYWGYSDVLSHLIGLKRAGLSLVQAHTLPFLIGASSMHRTVSLAIAMKWCFVTSNPIGCFLTDQSCDRQADWITLVTVSLPSDTVYINADLISFSQMLVLLCC